MYRKILVSLVIAGVLGACASTGNRIDPDDIDKIEKGVTTEAEIREIFGKPPNQQRNDDGSKWLIYGYGKSEVKKTSYIPVVGSLLGGSTGEAQTLAIQIDTNGIVEGYQFTESEMDTKGAAETALDQ